MNVDILTQLGLNYKTDKAAYHQFTPIYHKFFEPIRDTVQSVLEVGVYNGASLRTWRDYFKNAQVQTNAVDRT